MTHFQSRYSPEEIARRGDEIYERDLRAQSEPDHLVMIVAIDIETGDYAVAETALAATCGPGALTGSTGSCGSAIGHSTGSASAPEGSRHDRGRINEAYDTRVSQQPY